jgi:hypothetical protein
MRWSVGRFGGLGLWTYCPYSQPYKREGSVTPTAVPLLSAVKVKIHGFLEVRDPDFHLAIRRQNLRELGAG